MNVNRIAAWSSSAIVAVVVVAGLIIAGSPGEQRLARFDQMRLEDLQGIQRGLTVYWDQHGALPDDLGDLVDGRALNALPTDPASGDAYAYSRRGARAAALCAVFDRPSTDVEPGSFWHHEAGRRCFDFDFGETSAPASHP